MPFSGVTHTYLPEQGQKSLEVKREIRRFLEGAGLSCDGVQEFLSNQPLTGAEDRRALQGLVIRLVRQALPSPE